MNSKKQFLKKSQLYLISNENITTASMSLKAGVNLVQLRIKEKEDNFFLKKALYPIRFYCKMLFYRMRNFM